MRAWQRRSARVATLVGVLGLTGALLTGTIAGGVAGATPRRQSDASTTTSTTSDSPRTIDVVGTGQVRGVPDVLSLTLGVSTRNKSAGAALQENSTLSKKLNGVLRDAGVDEKDIQTANLSISPVYDDNGENIIAYSVNNTIDVTIRNLDKAGDIVDAAAGVAGDSIVVNSLAFSFDDNSALVAQARADAVKRGKAQAEQLAKAAGVDLGDILNISEASTPEGPTVLAAPKEASASDSGTPIQPGTESLTVQVNMKFKIT
jgi:uncharacterized protein YggE